MWIAKFKFTHDCILGNRTKKFNVSLQSVSFSTFKKKNDIITYSTHHMTGDKKNIVRFINDLKKDKDIVKVERHGDTFFLIEKAKSKAVAFHNAKIIFVKPVLVRTNGYEIWEVGSWEKQELSNFIEKIEKQMENFQLLKFVYSKKEDIFFPRLMPNLTPNQKRALEVAIEQRYYETPRKTDLRKLAKLRGISLSTFQEHLRKAEEKTIPNVLSYIE